MDLTFVVGTDIATFYLYDPTLLQHRQQAPWGWAIEESIPEYADGRLVCVPALLTWHAGDFDPDAPHGLTSMGSDGVFHVRCTTDTLTGAEALAEKTSLRRSAQLVIASGTVYLDGGYVLPHAPRGGELIHAIDDALDFGGLVSIHLAPGVYTVDIRYIVHEEEDEEQEAEECGFGLLPHIVLTFQRMA